MKKTVFLTLCFVCHLFASAFCYDNVLVSSVATVNFGVRQDQFSYNIDDITPGVTSHHKWDKEKFWTVGVIYNAKTCNGFLFNAEGRYAIGYEGRYTRSINVPVIEMTGNSSRNHASDAFVSIGYDLPICLGGCFADYFKNFSFFPLAGWNFHEQFLRYSNLDLRVFGAQGEVVFETPVTQLHAKQKAKWDGPWIGFAFDFRYNKCTNIWFEYQHEFTEYRSKATHFEIDNPASRHFAKGNGHGDIFRVGASSAFWCVWQSFFRIEYLNFWVTKGHDKQTHTLPDDITVKRPLRNVSWKSLSIVVGVARAF